MILDGLQAKRMALPGFMVSIIYFNRLVALPRMEQITLTLQRTKFCLVQNHFIPEFYFSPWLNETGHIIRFGWMRGKLTRDPKTPGQICYVVDLHTFTGTVGKLDKDAVESWLTNIDTNAAKAIKDILSDGLKSIGDEGATHLATFILSLIVRSPEQVGYLNERAAPDFQKTLDAQDAQVQGDPELLPTTYGFTSLQDYTERVHPGLIENVGRVLITDIISDVRYVRRVVEMDWWTIDFSSCGFGGVITSDRLPVIVGKGLDDPQVLLVLPLSPSTVLYLSPPGWRARMTAGGKGPLGIWTMKMILSTARQFAFARKTANVNLISKYLRRGA